VSNGVKLSQIYQQREKEKKDNQRMINIEKFPLNPYVFMPSRRMAPKWTKVLTKD